MMRSATGGMWAVSADGPQLEVLLCNQYIRPSIVRLVFVTALKGGRLLPW